MRAVCVCGEVCVQCGCVVRCAWRGSAGEDWLVGLQIKTDFDEVHVCGEVYVKCACVVRCACSVRVW